MASTEEQDRRIVLEFCHLLEKSKQLFNGLRDLPQYGEREARKLPPRESVRPHDESSILTRFSLSF